MGQGLTGGTHTYSRFRDLVFGAIPSGIEDSDGNREVLDGADSLIGDHGSVAFDGMIDDSYGSATTFEAMYRFLREQFFPRCAWGPMYLKDSKSYFFCDSLDFVGLEAGRNGLRPSLRKRESILQWPTPSSQEEVEAFCYLTPFLRRFIPGRAELVRIMKYGNEMPLLETRAESQNKQAITREVPFQWSKERDVAFQAMKQAIANNAMALPDPEAQYHLAVDASKRGIGGIVFQLEGIEAGTEAGNSASHRTAERIVMFMSFRLSDVETRYSNSEREALAVIRCLAEIGWIVIASKHPVLVYTDHSALKTLLTGLDNDAHGRIARWQERLGEYDIQLLHRSAKTHFMGIADGLSRLPTRLLQNAISEDSEGPRPLVGNLVAVMGLTTDVMVNAYLAMALRMEEGFWGSEKVPVEERSERKSVGVGVTWGKNAYQYMVCNQMAEMGEVQEKENALVKAANDLRRRSWKKWLESGMYGAIVQARLDELETGLVGAGKMKLGRSQKRALERAMRRYVLVDGVEPKLFYRERNGELASCVLEEDIEKVLTNLHEGHGHFAIGITLGRAYGRVYWPSRANDIGRWVSSCDSCQRVTKIQKAGELWSVIQFKPMDMIGMDYVGPINPTCKATGNTYILVVIDYFSRFLWAFRVNKDDQMSTMKALLDHVFPVVGWPLSVYSDNGCHFTGQLISTMWKDHGVMHFTSAISHPQSVGLSERYVQMLMGRIRLACLSLGSSDYWSREIRNAVLAINTRCIRIHGYTPAEILLGFNPSSTRKAEEGFEQWAKKMLAPEVQGGINQPDESHLLGYIDTRDERGLFAGEQLAQKQDHINPKKTPSYHKPEIGDMVLVRDFVQAKDRGRKLDARWSTPRVLEKISHSGVSGHVRQLHDPPGKSKRFHFDDLLLYVPREGSCARPAREESESLAVQYERGAMGDVQGVWSVGQRSFDLGDIDEGIGS